MISFIFLAAIKRSVTFWGTSTPFGKVYWFIVSIRLDLKYKRVKKSEVKGPTFDTSVKDVFVKSLTF